MSKVYSEEEDAFGHALMDHLEGHDANELVERNDGFIAVSAGAETYFAEPRGAQRTVADRATGRVLDVGCGAGRYALYLQDEGLEVVGIDVSPLAVEVCRRRGLRDVRLLALEDVDASLGSFDTVLMLGHNLGLLRSASGARRILKRLHDVVSPGGALIAETHDPYQSEDPLHHAYHARNRASGRMGGQIRMRVRYKAYKSPWFSYLLVSQEELEKLLKGTGWRVGEVIAVDGPSYAVRIVREGE